MKTHWLAGCILLTGLMSPALVAGEDDPRYSIEELKSEITTSALLLEARKEIQKRRSDLRDAESVDDDDEIDDLEDELEILYYVESELKKISIRAGESDIFQWNSYADRILQTVNKPVEGAYLPGFGKLAKNIGWGVLVGQKMPHIPKWRQEKPIGESAARKESAYLIGNDGDSFMSAKELAKLTPLQIAALDISEEHPIWYNQASLQSMRGSALSRFENFIVDGMTGALLEDDDLDKGRRYPIQDARKVLFLEDIYKSATSPKGMAEDAFGTEWKLKWGDEVAIEPVTSRLYLLAGGKMTDISYTNGFGPSDLIVILRDSDDQKKNKDDKHYPVTVDELIASVDELYGFDLGPYIHSQGVVNDGNVDHLLKNLPKGGKKKYKKNRVIGREWVAFRESSSELETKGFVRRHDGSRMSDIVAMNDRATRGLYLFDMWIANRDAKDDNNKAFFVKEMQGDDMEITKYYEGHHDMGLALGSLWSAGEVNQFKVGRPFAKRGLFGNIRVKQAVIFRPVAWDAATWTDCRWMAENIAGISEIQIREAVAASGWPDFAQEAMVYRLVARQQRLSELYGLNSHGAKPAAPKMEISLASDREITEAEVRYNLARGSLHEELSGAGVTSEEVLVDGTIANCRESAIVRLLIQQRYPSGLDTRYARKGKTPPKCLEIDQD